MSSGNVYYYAEDFLGSSRVITDSQGNVCYEADFDPYGTEWAVTTSCAQNYKFQGKERDAETNNDDFGARYYSSRLGRWLSADWSSVPAPVPYANLTNPQTLNLYAMVRDNPETFADLDGHFLPSPEGSGGDMTASPANSYLQGRCLTAGSAKSSTAQPPPAQQTQQAATTRQFVVVPDPQAPSAGVYVGRPFDQQSVNYYVHDADSSGEPGSKNSNHTVELREKVDSGNVGACTSPGSCTGRGVVLDDMRVFRGEDHVVEKRFTVDGHAAKVFDKASGKAYDYVKVTASYSPDPKTKPAFVFEYFNDPKH